MVTPDKPPSPDELDRIYDTWIRPSTSGDSAETAAPLAVFVVGQPGSGTTFAAARVRQHVAGPAPLHVASRLLRPYHPLSHAGSFDDPSREERIRQDLRHWFGRLIEDSLAPRQPLVIETSGREPAATVQSIKRVREAGYQVACVVLTADRDYSLQASVTRFDRGLQRGLPVQFVTNAQHEAAYEGTAQVLESVERDTLVQQLQVVTPEGRHLYRNRARAEGLWVQEAVGVQTLHDYRERLKRPQELADSGLRWQALAHRCASQPSVPREWASQVFRWRDSALALAEQDPDARQMLQWGRWAEAFRVLPPLQAVRELPQLETAAKRLEDAVRYAEQTFAEETDRRRFVDQTKQRLAERIAEGRLPGTKSRTKDVGGRGR